MSRFAWATTIAIFIVAIVAPILGAIADHSAIKKKLLAIFAGIGISPASRCSGSPKASGLALTLFIIGNVGVAGSIVFYESLLPHLVGQGPRSRLLGRLRDRLLRRRHPAGDQPADDPEAGAVRASPTPASATRLSFASVGLWWLVFSLPLILRVPEPRALVGGTQQKVSLTGRVPEPDADVQRPAQVSPGATLPDSRS